MTISNDKFVEVYKHSKLYDFDQNLYKFWFCLNDKDIETFKSKFFNKSTVDVEFPCKTYTGVISRVEMIPYKLSDELNAKVFFDLILS